MLEDWHIRVMIQAQAIGATLEGMKAENKIREMQGFHLKHDEDSFDLLRQELEELVNQLRY